MDIYEGEKEAVDKERIMKILAGIITIAGIVMLAFLILDNKAEQRKVQQVAAEDEKKTQSPEYIEMEELENQDKEKQKELKTKANGNQDILITVDGIDKSLYTTVYPGVAGLESRGTFILKDGIAPGERPEDISREEFDDLVVNGWNYAYSVSMQEDNNLENWTALLDAAIGHWNECGIGTPDVYVCSATQYQEAMDVVLQERGFHFLIIIKDDDAALEGAYDGAWHILESTAVRGVDSNISTYLQSASKKKQSLGITVRKVQEQVEDPNQDLNLEQFNELLSQLQQARENGVQILSYQEYVNDRNASNAELATLQEEYQNFLKDKNARVEKLTKRLEDED